MPEILRRRAMARGESATKTGNLLFSIMKIASEEEGNPQSSTHLKVATSLASIHTSQASALHCLYDLAARPKYLGPIRDEIGHAVEEDEPWS